MLVRAVRSRQRGRLIRVVALTILAIAALSARPVFAQEPVKPMPKTHTVKRGDTLWDIAKLYLGDAFLWPEIYRLNSGIIEDPHWIYPGELLKLPGERAKVIAVTPPPPSVQPSAPAQVLVAPPRVDSAPPAPPPPGNTVRVGEFAAAPWVDQRGGPRLSGYIMQSADIPGIASVDRSRMQLYDRILVSPPAGAVVPERERFLVYRLGPLIEDFGQIVIPTGIVEITQAPGKGEAASARVVKIFSEILQGQRLIRYDTNAAIALGRPTPVTNGRTGKVRWIYNEPVLTSLQSYLVLDLSRGTGVNTGDQIELYQPRQNPTDGRELAIPEVSIGRAQVLRVTPFGATAIVTSQEQPKIEQGTAARVAAKMP